MEEPLKQIRTYQGDIADILKTQHESVFSIQRQEQARNARVATPSTTTESPAVPSHAGVYKNILVLFGIILLLAAGGVGLWYAYTTYEAKTAAVAVTTVPNQLIASDSNTSLDALTASRESIIALLQTERSANDKTLRQIIPRTGAEDGTLLSTDAFFSLVAANAPKPLVRSLDTRFMLGTLGGHTFLLLPITSFENAYPGLLAWEANLQTDVLPLFVDATTTQGVAPDTAWKDLVIENKNTRALQAEDGTPVLIYTFIGQQALLITDNPATLKAIVSRINAEKLSR